MATTLTDTRGIIAIAAAGVALLALLGCVALLVRVRGLQRRQRLVLGDSGERDLVAHASEVQQAFEALRAYVDDVAIGLDARLGGIESALRNTIARRALVRYDAYNELSG